VKDVLPTEEYYRLFIPRQANIGEAAANSCEYNAIPTQVGHIFRPIS